MQFRIHAVAGRSGPPRASAAMPAATLSSSPLAGDLEGGVDGGLRILHLGQLDRARGGAKGVAGVRVLQFDNGADVAADQFLRGRAVAPVEEVNLADALGDLAVGVVKFHPGLERAGIDAEKRELAKMGLGHRLENVGHRFRVGQADLGHAAGGVDRRVAFAVDRRGAVLGDEIHQAGDAHVGFR